MSIPAVPELDAMWGRIVSDVPISSRAWPCHTKPIAMHSNTVMLTVSDETTRERIKTKLHTEIETKLSMVTGTRTYLAFVIDPSLQVETPDLEIASPLSLIDKKIRHHRSANPNSDLKLNPRYTFGSFVAGSSSRFAHAAAAAVAKQPGKSYNPPMIYGPSGLGKTHLLHAIGHYVRSYYENLQVCYVSTEELTNDFTNAISDNRTVEFRYAYHDVDVLLADDIQFLESKIQTQEKFFHTFNTLHNAQKQVVMSSDRPPRLLETFEPRLRSRFEWDLTTDIQPPDLGTHIAVLRKRAASQRLTAGTEVLEHIASHVTTNICGLEGALTRVAALASLNQQEIILELTERVLCNPMPEGNNIHVDADSIITATCAYFGISADELTGASRAAALAWARQIAAYLCRELIDLSLPKIGSRFGGHDHTTVMHSVKKIDTKMGKDHQLFDQMTKLTNRIKQG